MSKIPRMNEKAVTQSRIPRMGNAPLGKAPTKKVTFEAVAGPQSDVQLKKNRIMKQYFQTLGSNVRKGAMAKIEKNRPKLLLEKNRPTLLLENDSPTISLPGSPKASSTPNQDFTFTSSAKTHQHPKTTTIESNQIADMERLVQTLREKLTIKEQEDIASKNRIAILEAERDALQDQKTQMRKFYERQIRKIQDQREKLYKDIQTQTLPLKKGPPQKPIVPTPCTQKRKRSEGTDTEERPSKRVLRSSSNSSTQASPNQASTSSTTPRTPTSTARTPTSTACTPAFPKELPAPTRRGRAPQPKDTMCDFCLKGQFTRSGVKRHQKHWQCFERTQSTKYPSTSIISTGLPVPDNEARHRRVSESSTETLDAPETEAMIEETNVIEDINNTAKCASFMQSSPTTMASFLPAQHASYPNTDTTKSFSNDYSPRKSLNGQFCDPSNVSVKIEPALPLPDVVQFIQDEEWKTNLVAKLNHLRQSQMLCDIMIRSSDYKMFKAHKVVMACASPVMIPHMESEADGVLMYNSEDICARIWELLLTYIYTGQVSVAKQDLNLFQKAAKVLKITIPKPTGLPSRTTQGTIRTDPDDPALISVSTHPSTSTQDDIRPFIKTEPTSPVPDNPPNSSDETCSSDEMTPEQNLSSTGNLSINPSLNDVDLASSDDDEDDYLLSSDDEGYGAKRRRRNNSDDQDFEPDFSSEEASSDNDNADTTWTEPDSTNVQTSKRIPTSDCSENWIIEEQPEADTEETDGNVNFEPSTSCIDTATSPGNVTAREQTEISGRLDSVSDNNHQNIEQSEHAENSDCESDNGDDTPTLCVLCGDDFANEKQFKEHSRIKHYDAENRCFVCLRWFPSQNHCNLHLKQCIDDKQCKICDKICINKASLVKHTTLRHPVLPFKCIKCGLRFDTKERAISHVDNIHRGPKTQTVALKKGRKHNIPCPLCKRIFSHKINALELHIWRTHKGRKFEKLFTCEVCGAEFRYKQRYTEHMARHATTSPFECDICKKSFRSKRLLSKHARVHGSKQFMCEYCGKEFTMKKYLQQHERIHSGVKPYICHHCGVAFAQKNSLNCHLKTHHKETKD